MITIAIATLVARSGAPELLKCFTLCRPGRKRYQQRERRSRCLCVAEKRRPWRKGTLRSASALQKHRACNAQNFSFLAFSIALSSQIDGWSAELLLNLTSTSQDNNLCKSEHFVPSHVFLGQTMCMFDLSWPVSGTPKHVFFSVFTYFDLTSLCLLWPDTVA